MASIIVGIKTPFGETSIIKASPEELESFANEYYLFPITPTLSFCILKAMFAVMIVMGRQEEQRMWFEERERDNYRQVRRRDLHLLPDFYDSITDARELRAGGLL